MRSTILYRISRLTAVLVLLGWVANVYAALFMEGGHPPRSAYVGMVTILASWVLNSIGTLCGLGGILTGKPSAGQILFVVLNAGLLLFSVLTAIR